MTDIKELIISSAALYQQCVLDLFRQDAFAACHSYLAFCSAFLPKSIKAEFEPIDEAAMSKEELKYTCRENFGALDKAVEKFKELNFGLPEAGDDEQLGLIVSNLQKLRESTVEQLVYEKTESIESLKKSIQDMIEGNYFQHLYEKAKLQ